MPEPKLIPFGFCGPTYVAASPVLNAERTINMFPEPGIQTSKSPMSLIGRPGLSNFMTLPQSPARALWAGNARMFAVGGTHFYELNPNGTVNTDYGVMAGSTGKGPCQIVANGTQLLVMDQSSRSIYNANPAGPVMTKVFDGIALEYLDGFYVAVAVGASLAGANPNQVNVSAFGDGTSWNALDFIIRTGSSDLVTQLAVLSGQLWIFGEKSIEVWYNAGNPLFPFARISGSTLALGLLAPYSVAKFYNTVMWLGADDRGFPQVYMSQGLNPLRVSTFAIERLISTYDPNTLIHCWAYGYQEAGHTFYVLNLCGDANFLPAACVVYDLTTGMWHERDYLGNWPMCLASSASFAVTSAVPQPNIVGDGRTGALSFQSTIIPNDNGNNIRYFRACPHVSDTNRIIAYPYFELDADLGAHDSILDYSNDGGRSFLGVNRSLLQATNQGFPTTSAWHRYWARQLGRSRDRVFSWTFTSNEQLVRIANGYLDVRED